MADDGEQGEYNLVLEDGTVKNSSRDYNGKATATYQNGEIYEGNFIGGLREGFGKYSYTNGDVYEGNFKENLKHGIGKMTYHEGIGTYHGYFESGKRHGEGVFIYKNGDVYSGWWKDGKKEGMGTYVLKESNMKMEGVWSNGFIAGGKWIFPNGVYFEGGFDNNQPKGEGVWVFPNGNTCKGEYSQTIIPSEEEGVKDTVKVAWATFSQLHESASAINTVL